MCDIIRDNMRHCEKHMRSMLDNMQQPKSDLRDTYEDHEKSMR